MMIVRACVFTKQIHRLLICTHCTNRMYVLQRFELVSVYLQFTTVELVSVYLEFTTVVLVSVYSYLEFTTVVLVSVYL